MLRLKDFFICACLFVVVSSCGGSKPKITDTLSSGTIDISADEAYRPVLDAEKKVFDSCYPDAKITIHYKTEADCIKDLFDNKARIVLISRDLSKEEKADCEQQQIYATSRALAVDAVAVISNNSAPDSEIGMNVIKGILTGVYKNKYSVVFDNKNSGMAGFISDSVLRGEKPGSNVFAVAGDSAAIDYVSKKRDALGFVGLSYVCAPEDSSNSGTFINSVRIMALQNAENTGIDNSTLRPFNKPYQAIIARRAYPLCRKLFYVSRESYPGLGTGFANFLAREQGQLIFAHAHLFPLCMNIVIREAAINN